MNSNTVYVVTGFELGWDNVVGVFSNISKEELLKCFPEDQYYIRDHSIETSLDMYE